MQLQLAEKMMEKSLKEALPSPQPPPDPLPPPSPPPPPPSHPSQATLTNNEELRLYLQILEQQGKLAEACQLLANPAGPCPAAAAVEALP
jgi:hypothetical protein